MHACDVLLSVQQRCYCRRILIVTLFDSGQQYEPVVIWYDMISTYGGILYLLNHPYKV